MIPPFNAGVLGEGRGYPGLEFHDFGVDHLHTLVVGDAHAPVAVLDDVGVAYIVETHRRQLFAAIGGPIYTLPPGCHARPSWQKRPIELPVTPHAPNYPLHRHGPRLEADLVVSAERLPMRPDAKSAYGLPRKAIQRASVNKRAVKSGYQTLNRIFTNRLQLGDSGMLRSYPEGRGGTWGEPRRAGDRHSRLCRVGTLDVTHDS